MEGDGGLTKRQTRVMNLVKHGYANKQIARKLGITIDTVRSHLHSVFRRMPASNKAHAVYLCMKRGIID